MKVFFPCVAPRFDGPPLAAKIAISTGPSNRQLWDHPSKFLEREELSNPVEPDS